MNRKYLIAALAIGIIAGAVGTAYGVTTSQAHMGGNAEQLAERLGISQEEATQKIAERKAEQEARMETHLNSLVSDGVITEDQKNALQQKQAEMQTKRDALMEQMQELHDEFESWAEQQGINLDDIRPERDGFGPGKHMRGDQEN